MSLPHFQKTNTRAVEEAVMSRLCALPLNTWVHDPAKSAFLLADLRKRTYEIQCSAGAVVKLAVIPPKKNQNIILIEPSDELRKYTHILMEKVYADEERDRQEKLSSIYQDLEMLQLSIG